MSFSHGCLRPFEWIIVQTTLLKQSGSFNQKFLLPFEKIEKFEKISRYNKNNLQIVDNKNIITLHFYKLGTVFDLTHSAWNERRRRNNKQQIFQTMNWNKSNNKKLPDDKRQRRWQDRGRLHRLVADCCRFLENPNYKDLSACTASYTYVNKLKQGIRKFCCARSSCTAELSNYIFTDNIKKSDCGLH